MLSDEQKRSVSMATCLLYLLPSMHFRGHIDAKRFEMLNRQLCAI
jgi:hypothetical protein